MSFQLRQIRQISQIHNGSHPLSCSPLRVTRGGLPLSGYLPPTMQAVPPGGCLHRGGLQLKLRFPPRVPVGPVMVAQNHGCASVYHDPRLRIASSPLPPPVPLPTDLPPLPVRPFSRKFLRIEFHSKSQKNGNGISNLWLSCVNFVNV